MKKHKSVKRLPEPRPTIEWDIEDWPLQCSNCGRKVEGGVLSVARGLMEVSICQDCLADVLEGIFEKPRPEAERDG